LTAAEEMLDFEFACSSAKSAGRDPASMEMRHRRKSLMSLVGFRQEAHIPQWRSLVKIISIFAAIELFSSQALVAAPNASAQTLTPVQFSGMLNDYSPSTVSGGPWEMHGQWTLSIDAWAEVANFSADLTMSGYGKTATETVDPTQGGQGVHTPHQTNQR
jgi:hypothetical protein